jgi:hypothetical protein
VLYDRIHKIQTIVKAFMTNAMITCINYGPYDNGHVLVGMSDGTLIAFDGVTMNKLFKLDIFECTDPIGNICFDPTQLVFVTS